MDVKTANSADKQTSTSNPTNGELPECKIKRNYSCSQCSYSTQNPRSHLEHLRDIHGEKIFINKCCLCLYASRHYQKLVRHMKMVHGSIEGIGKQSKKRPYSETSTWLEQARRIPSPILPPLPPLPEPVETTINMNNLSNDLELSRNTLKDISALYFAQGHIEHFITQMEQSDAMLFPSTSKSLFDERKNSNIGNDSLMCNCGFAAKCFSQSLVHRRSCSFSNEMSSLNLHRCQNCEQWCKTRVDLLHHQCSYLDEVTINLSSESTRCQHCRLWCMSYADLVNHLQNCVKAAGLQDQDSPLGIHTKQDNNKPCNILNEEKVQETHRESIDDTRYFAIETALGYGKVIKEIAAGEELKSESLKKVFKCPRCPFWAGTASRFHIHVVGHLNKKPFKCSLCAYRSNWRWDITKHIRIRIIRSSCHKNARVVMNSEAGRVDYAKYNRYSSLIKIIDEDAAAKLTKACEVIENQVGAQPVLPNNTSQCDNKRGSNRPVSHLEAVAKHTCSTSRSAESNAAKKEMDLKSQVFATRHSKGSSALSQETINSGNTELRYSLNSSEDSQIVQSSKTIYTNQSHERKSEINNNSLLNGPIHQEILPRGIVEPMQSGNDTSQKETDIEPFSNCTPTPATCAIVANEKAPPPFRCGHCHQVSNWKHVIQRHCRLKHSGYLRIEAYDRNSDRCDPVYRSFEINSNRISNYLPGSSANELSDSKHDNHSQDSFHSSSDQESKVNNLEILQLPSASSHFRCSSCPYVSKTRNQFNLHMRTHNTPTVTQPDPFENNTLSTDNRPVNNSNSEDTVNALQKCPYCPFQSAHVKSFQRHLKYHTCDSNSSEEHSCEHCDFSSTSEDIIAEHAKIHLAGSDNSTSVTSFTSYDNLELVVTAGNETDDADRPTSTFVDFKGYDNTEKEKMSPPSPKTILVNPKTGQIIKRAL